MVWGGLVDALACRRPTLAREGGSKKKRDVNPTPSPSQRQGAPAAHPPLPPRLPPGAEPCGVRGVSLCAAETPGCCPTEQRNPVNVSTASPGGSAGASGRQLSLDGCCWHFAQPWPPVRVCVCVSYECLPPPYPPPPPPFLLNTLPRCAELQVQMSGLQSK